MLTFEPTPKLRWKNVPGQMPTLQQWWAVVVCGPDEPEADGEWRDVPTVD
jgi:hypothetical protein